MWRDETMSAAIVDRSFFDTARVIFTHEAGMGPYHVGLWFWSLAGSSDRWLRAFSVAGGAATAVALFHLITRWFDRRTAALSLVFLVANPVFLMYLTESRAYSWSMFLAVLSTLCVTRALAKDASARWTVVYGVVIGIGVGVNAVAAFVLVAHVVATAWSGRHGRHVWTIFGTATVVAALAFLPFLPVTLSHGSTQTSWIQGLTLRGLPSMLAAIVGGRRWAVLLLLGLGACALFTIVRSRRPSTGWVDHSHMILALAVVPPVLLVAVSEIRPLFVPRYLTPSLPFIAAAAAVGFSQVQVVARWFVPALAASVAVLLFVAGSPFAAHSRDDLRAAARFLSDTRHLATL